jgi:hypothetical protein
MLPALLTFGLGYGLIQLETNKIAAQQSLDEYQARVRLIGMIKSDPNIRMLMDAFNANFPQEMSHVLETFTQNTMRRKRGLNGGIEYRAGEILGLVTQFLSSQSTNISRSSDQQLVRVFAAQKAYFEGLSRFPALCAATVDGNKAAFSQSDDPILKQSADPDEMNRLSRMITAMLDAAGEGRRHPQMRDFTNPPPKLVSAMAALPIKQRQLLEGELNGSTSERCAAQIGINEAIFRLPQPDIAFWTAYLHSLSNAAQSGLAPNA